MCIMKKIKSQVTGYYKLLDKDNYGTLVVETSNAHYKLTLDSGKVVHYTQISLVPYHLLDSDVYEMIQELSKEEFEDELKLDFAKNFSKTAHKGQKDKSGVDYFSGHVTFVANNVKSTKAKIVAYLHDVIEDTDVTKEEIRNLFSPEISNAVILLTKDSKKEDYLSYVKKIKKNDLAREVKLADLRHNSDLSRLSTITEKDLARQKRYEKAISILTN